MRGLRGIVLASLTTLLPFCSSDDEQSCMPGRVASCPCPGGAVGVQSCRDDGRGYGPCEQCQGGDASAGRGGSGGGSGGSAGASGRAGSAGTAGAPGDAGDASSDGGGDDGSAGASGSGGASGSSGASGGAGASGSGGSAGDAGPARCPAGSVTDAMQGSCDLLLQNCPRPYTCTIQQSGATWRTECATLGAGTKQLGATCSGPHSECAIGLRCTAGKCTRPCCPQREAQYCGTGLCDLTINFESGAAHLQVCSFSPTCTPFASNCPAGPERDCHIAAQDRFLCDVPNYGLDAGSTVGKGCIYRNDCGDSQYCAITGTATTGTCRWLCRAASGGPDAGTVGGAPGQGGCPAGQTCRAFSAPTWLGVCLPP